MVAGQTDSCPPIGVFRHGADVTRKGLFRQSDVTRALRGAYAAGAADVRIDIEHGRMTIITGRAAAKEAKSNGFDEAL